MKSIRPRADVRVGVIGRGSIGQVLVDELSKHAVTGVQLVAIMDQSGSQAPSPAAPSIPVLTPDLLQEFAQACDLVVECAGQQPAKELVPSLLCAGVDVLLCSVGVLADNQFEALVKESGHSQQPGRLFLPAGAIGGLDILDAARRMGEIITTTVTTTKRPEVLLQPWMDATEQSRIGTTSTAIEVWSGPAKEAAILFPTNINVAATVAQAVGSWDVVRTTLIADPNATLTTHQIHVVGAAGTYSFQIHNLPSPANPRSSGVVPYAVLCSLSRFARNGGII